MMGLLKSFETPLACQNGWWRLFSLARPFSLTRRVWGKELDGSDGRPSSSNRKVWDKKLDGSDGRPVSSTRRVWGNELDGSKGKPLSMNRRVGGKELDGFNGNTVKNMFLHGETLPKTKYSGNKQERDLWKQTEKLRRFIPKPKYGVLKTASLKTKGMKFDTQSDVDKFINEQLAICSPGNVSDLMHATVKVKKKNPDLFLLSEHLPAIAMRLKVANPSDWRFRDISTIMYGLQCSKGSDMGVVEVLIVITAAAERGITESLPWTSQDASMMLLGLRKISCWHEASRKLLSVITKMIPKCADHYDEQNIGNSLLGLQGMSSECLEVGLLLNALTVKVLESSSKLSSQALGNALSGLQGMCSDCPEVRSLLSALTEKVLGSTAELSAQAVSDSLSGLRGMSSECTVVRTLLSALTPKYRESKRRLSSTEIGDAFYGMRSMNSASQEVRELLSVLLLKLNRPTDDLSISSICASLSGLQEMDTKTAEVKETVAVLLEGFAKKTEELTPIDTGNALEALPLFREVLGDAEYKGSLVRIFLNLNRILYRDDGQEATATATASLLCLEDLLHLYQSLSLALPETQVLLKPSQMKGFLRLHSVLTDEVTTRRKNGCTHFDPNPDRLGVPSIAKKTLLAAAVKLSKEIGDADNFFVETDTFILSLFKADILLTVACDSGGSGPSTVQINFEVSGDDDRNSKGASFCRRRDAYLTSRGFRVVRVEASKVAEMSESALIKLLRSPGRSF
jgi:hypothetical protein